MIKYLLISCIAVSAFLFHFPVLLADQTLTLVSQNMNRLFDTHDDANKAKVLTRKSYERKINLLIDKIVHEFEHPDVLAFQEIENIGILHDIVQRLETRHLSYQPILLEGHDVSGIDVGFLVSKRYRVTRQQQLFARKKIPGSDAFLFSRPPLLIEICRDECITIINLHLRSMRQLDNRKYGPHVISKRKNQGEILAQWINQFQLKNPTKRIVLIGDFNALPHSDRYVDVIGTIRGQPDQRTPRWKSKDFIQRDLIDLTKSIAIERRHSYLYKGQKQQLDYLLISDIGNYQLDYINFGRITYKISDHAPLKARLVLYPVNATRSPRPDVADEGIADFASPVND